MDDHIEELLPFYALGTLTDSERSQVEAYIASNPDARQRLEGMLQAASALPQAIEPMQPSAELKAKLMGRVRADAETRFAAASRPRAVRPSGGRWAYAFAVACLLLAAGIGLWGLGVNKEAARLRAQVAVLQQEVQTQRTVLAELSSPNAQTFAISGTEHQPQAQGHLIADPSAGSGVLVVSGLQPLGAGNTYEFWLIKDKTAVPAGLFKVDQGGTAVLRVTHNIASDSYNAIGVSVEPAGGSQQPTGDIVMLGKLQ